MYSDLKLFIDGQWLNGEGRKGEDVINPATGKVLAHLPHASKADLDAALAAAQKGFQVWKNTSAYDRAKIMRKAADLVRERHDHISKVMTQEQGKPYVESRGEVLTSADIIDWYAEEGRRAYGRIVPGRVKGVRQIVTQEPVGVVAAFTPWNFPTLTPVRKIAGALAAGCSIIIKASEETPSNWSNVSPMPACRPVSLIWFSACRRKCRSISSRPTSCARCRSPARSRSASILPH
jgi:succinate-semialdehyde dehydrogenase/glutarate-semialdehyde dehydrogenase